jgi:hypothetical protein
LTGFRRDSRQAVYRSRVSDFCLTEWQNVRVRDSKWTKSWNQRVRHSRKNLRLSGTTRSKETTDTNRWQKMTIREDIQIRLAEH